MAEALIDVEVVYALATVQRLVPLKVPAGTTARQAVERCELAAEFPDLDVQTCLLGIFGKALVDPQSRVLEAGDRVEIYRPLIADPKEVRKQRAAKAAAKRQ
jgi:putative ubiquitin-RnfH superfamily antitoxin RatB of RatAB toxin-antitoxin module